MCIKYWRPFFFFFFFFGGGGEGGGKGSGKVDCIFSTFKMGK